MGYTTENPPVIIRSILQEYDVRVKECGFKGSWATVITEDDQSVKISREITNDIRIEAIHSTTIRTGITNGSYNNVLERDEMIDKHLIEELGGYETLSEAVSSIHSQKV